MSKTLLILGMLNIALASMNVGVQLQAGDHIWAGLWVVIGLLWGFSTYIHVTVD